MQQNQRRALAPAELLLDSAMRSTFSTSCLAVPQSRLKWRGLSPEGYSLAEATSMQPAQAPEPAEPRTESWVHPWDGESRSALQRGHVDHEPVLHILPQHSLEGLVDLLDRNGLDVGDNVVLAAVV